MKRCRCGRVDVTHSDHASNIDGDLHVHAKTIACFVIERGQQLPRKVQ
jgi:hypothetical protein